MTPSSGLQPRCTVLIHSRSVPFFFPHLQEDTQRRVPLASLLEFPDLLCTNVSRFRSFTSWSWGQCKKLIDPTNNLLTPHFFRFFSPFFLVHDASLHVRNVGPVGAKNPRENELPGNVDPSKGLRHRYNGPARHTTFERV